MALSYSYEMQAKVFDRMTAIEQQKFTIPQTLHEALQLASNLEKERSVVVDKLAVSDAKLAIAEPKADALDVIANTEGLYGLQDQKCSYHELHAFYRSCGFSANDKVGYVARPGEKKD